MLATSASATFASLLRRAATLAAALALLLAALGPAFAAAPQRGSPTRAAIIEAMRPLVEREVGAPVVLLVSAINVEGPFAFVSATPARPGGQPIDWSQTRHARARAADAMSDVTQALLTGEGANWTVIEFAFGPTDVPWEEWITRRRAPRRLFEEAYAQAQPAPPPAQQPPPAPAPPPQPAAQPAAQPWAPGADWRTWRLGDLTFATPPGWRSLDSQTKPLRIGGEPWSATFSDSDMNSGRGAMLVFSWADDEFIYSNSLDDTNILGRGRQVFAHDLAGERRFFRLRDRYNDAQGFDVVAALAGKSFHIGCRAPAARWPRLQDVCEQILASVAFPRAAAPVATAQPKPEPPKPVATPQAPPEPVAVAPVVKPAPDAKDVAFRAFTEGMSKLEAFEASKNPDDWQAGFEAAQRAVEAQPQTADYWRLYGYAASLGADQSALAQQTAEDAFEKAVALDPANTGARLLYAGALIKRESWSKALDQMEAALSTKPDLATSPLVADMARMYLADAQAARGHAFFAKLSAQRPRAQAIRLGQAVMAKELGKKDEATALAEKVAADPQAAQTDGEHARALLQSLKE